MIKILFIFTSAVILASAQMSGTHKPTLTTASGYAAPKKFQAGSLIFEENFNTLDKKKWAPEVTLAGGGNGEFQWYVRDDENSYVKNGKLHLEPTLTADKIGYDTVENGYVKLDDCTDDNKENCERKAGGNVIINPVRSARLVTKNSFSFKYGHVEVVAKMPQGDWLWPAIWLLPTNWTYGDWPRSGEIDLLESRGNLDYKDHNGVQIGVQQVGSTLHFGPRWDQDAYPTATYPKNNPSGYHNGFHKFEFIWNEEGITFLVDGEMTGYVAVGDGFWKRGGFTGENIWTSGTKMAPFDQEFHFLINLAVGGTNGYFPEYQNKPWLNSSPTAMKDFWTKRQQWHTTWAGDQHHLIVDSVKVWAL